MSALAWCIGATRMLDHADQVVNSVLPARPSLLVGCARRPQSAVT
jgi:hypothetical protein